jgi:hypothetical protein
MIADPPDPFEAEEDLFPRESPEEVLTPDEWSMIEDLPERFWLNQREQ